MLMDSSIPSTSKQDHGGKTTSNRSGFLNLFKARSSDSQPTDPRPSANQALPELPRLETDPAINPRRDHLFSRMDPDKSELPRNTTLHSRVPNNNGGVFDAASTNGVFIGDRDDQGPEARVNTHVQELVHERDNYQELLRDAVSRIFYLENRLKMEEQHPEVELLQQKAMEINKRSKQNVTALNSDITDLQYLYKVEKHAKDSLRLQLVGCQKELELQKSTLKARENSLEQAESSVKRLNDELFNLQQNLTTVQAAVTTLKQDRSTRIKDGEASVERNLILAHKCEDLERKTAETMSKLEEAVEFGEKAVRARDQLAIRLREYAAEMTELRDDEAKTYKELTERSKHDIQHIKQASEKVITELRDDIRLLESKLTDKDIELNRTIREVRMLQMHAERMERESLATFGENSTHEDLFRRLASAEQDRDRLTLLVQSTQTSLKQKVDLINQKEVKFEKSMKDQNVRLKETVDQCEHLNKEHVAMADEIQRLQAQLGVKEKSLQILNRDIQADIFSMKEKARIAEADRTAREEAMEESQRQSLLDMQQVNKLLRQQVAHWQAEFNNLQNTNELRIRELKDRLGKAKNRQHELEFELARQNSLNTDMVTRMEDVKNAMIAMNSVPVG